MILTALRRKDADIFVSADFESELLPLTVYVTSLFSSIFGMAKFLKSGPCRLIPNEGPLGGYATGPFFVLFLATLFMFIAKIFSCLYFIDVSNPYQIIVSFSLNCGIPFLYVSILKFTSKSKVHGCTRESKYNHDMTCCR